MWLSQLKDSRTVDSGPLEWEEFKEEFLERFIPLEKRDVKIEEFINLTQRRLIIEEYF